jgi:hypothetical protein
MDLRSWAKKDAAIAPALARLAKLPPSPDHPGRVLHPLPAGDKKYHDVIGHEAIAARIKTAPTKQVPVASLHSNGQKSVRPGQVAHYIAHPTASGHGHKSNAKQDKYPTDKPVVVHLAGKNYLYDGHHRGTAAVLRGDKHLDCRYVDLDQKKPQE